MLRSLRSVYMGRLLAPLMLVFLVPLCASGDGKPWSFQPVHRPPVPVVKNNGWSSHPVDRFLLAKLGERGLAPAPDANRRTLIRRLSYVLTGLPPKPAEVEEFVNDPSPDAFERIVDRLLASPHFGERWARHWMDVVRYCETHGSEYDHVIPAAWRYRDYLIRAFNDDVPYDQLVREHIAGDLIPPRWNGGINEAIIGTAFYRFVEFYHSPVDVKREEGAVIDNQIDALSKSFQALTISCARCHVHKFDPISNKDFYGLYGILASTRTVMNVVEPVSTFHTHDEELRQLKSELRRALADHWLKSLERWPSELSAARAALQRLEQAGTPAPPKEKAAPKKAPVLPPGWEGALRSEATKQVHHPIYPLSQLARLKPEQQTEFTAKWQELQQSQRAEGKKRQAPPSAFADFRRGIPEGWRTSGPGIPTSPIYEPGDFAVVPTGEQMITAIYPAGVYSHLLSERHGGSLRSPDFTIDQKLISVLVCGNKGARLRLVIENFQSDSVLFGVVNPDLKQPHLSWVTMKMRDQWKGCRAYLELLTRDDKPYVGAAGADKPGMHHPTDGRSAFGIVQVVFHDERWKPLPSLALDSAFWESPVDSWDILVALFSKTVATALQAWKEGRCDKRQALLLDALLEAGVLDNRLPAGSRVARLIQRYRTVENQIPVATRVPGVCDDQTGQDSPLFTGGDHKQPASTVPRRYLEVFGCAAYDGRQSGRLQLARDLTSTDNPLTARVMVNRIWHYLFGKGLVASVDNFGKLGDRPTHAELLDYLASQFMADGWSVKKMIRSLVTTRAWQAASVPSERAAEIDPNNDLLQHANVRRLEAEAIRDAILVSAETLNPRPYGPSVAVWLPDSLVDAQRPKSGPVDGDNRRGLYIEVRRNFPSEFLLLFDMPKPAGSAGRRSVTNVPAQSLLMLNDPFVLQQAERWAWRLMQANTVSERDRVARMYERAFGRPPTALEIDRALEFLHEQRSSGPKWQPFAKIDMVADFAAANAAFRAWKDLAHVIFNMKEFIVIQ